ncbi:MAG: lactoylglutathione lyase [Alphaproteobacteria bacterium]|nr:MAG: lactoylglutathione lyase [Alphaproteobacteria bacterium]
MPTPGGIRHLLETCLYVDDLARSRAFYEKVIGLSAGFSDRRMAAYRVGDTMLLLFARGATLEPVEMASGTIPAHDGAGPAHFAFSIEADALERWARHLEANGAPVESRVTWPGSGAVSLYFRDPDGHLVEMATPGLWGIA